MDAATEGRRYRAFISYSHADAAAARWLHKRLEGFAMPARLVGRPGPHGLVSARLTPIFKDRDDLPAAHDLTDQVRAALAASGCLIVLATPAAAASRYVEQEIMLFRQLHPDRPVLAALWTGEPDAAFPPALRRMVDGTSIEPLAADFRPAGDGRRLALLKLVAGVTGVDLDALVQREAQRRLRRVTAITVAALIGMLAMGGLAAFAITARAEADRQRGQAEGLIDFMLTDLRARLKGVGRLDALISVNMRALSYYASQDIAAMPAASLDRRARLLEAMGADNEARGDLDAALASYREAHRTTAALLAADPANPDRIFGAAQSEYWLGHAAEMRGDIVGAARGYGRYRDAARRLLALAPQDPRAMAEMGYAECNLGILALNARDDADGAVPAFTAAVGWFAAASAAAPGRTDLAFEHANALAWLADATLATGDAAGARRHRLADRAIKQRLAVADGQNRRYAQAIIVSDRALAQIDRALGATARAEATLAQAAAAIAALVAIDPANADWRDQAGRIAADRAQLLLDVGRPAPARALLTAARSALQPPGLRAAAYRDRDGTAARIDRLLKSATTHCNDTPCP